MSTALYSEPWFARGQTLGVTSTADGLGIIGTERWFRDVNPATGVVNSNVPVKCVAMRNTSGAALLPKVLAKAEAAAILTGVDGDATADSPVVGVVDEYLPAAGVAANDIFWLVVSGPAVAVSSGAISQGAFVGATTGAVIASVANKTIGVAIAAASGNLCRVLLGLGSRSARCSTP